MLPENALTATAFRIYGNNRERVMLRWWLAHTHMPERSRLFFTIASTFPVCLGFFIQLRARPIS
ncbi:hypothetical protein ABG299_001079 [Salmonella enterica subsp. enterica]